MNVMDEGTGTTGQAALRPVFVVGNPRSGTTLVQQILSAHVEFWTASATIGDTRFLSIRYEDLVSDPELVLDQLTAHAGVQKDSSALHRFNDQFGQVTLAKPSIENKAFNSATGLVDRRSMWKKRLTAQEAKVVETICGPLMTQHGYPKEYPPSVLATIQIAITSIVNSIERRTRKLRNTAQSLLKSGKASR